MAQIAPPQPIDTLMHFWQQYKVATSLQSEASLQQAEIIREAATTSNTTLVARAAVIQRAREAQHRARTPRVNAGTGEEQEHPEEVSDEDRESFMSPPASANTSTPSANIRTPRTQDVPNRSTTAQHVRELLAEASNPNVSNAEITQVAGLLQQVGVIGNNHIIHAPPSGPSYLPQTKTERLRELQSLFEEGTINAEELATGRAAIIRS